MSQHHAPCRLETMADQKVPRPECYVVAAWLTPVLPECVFVVDITSQLGSIRLKETTSSGCLRI